MAARDRAELLLLHVCLPVAVYAAAEIPGNVLTRFVEEDRELARAELRRLRDRLRQTGCVSHVLMIEGKPAEQIARVAERLRCDLIVLATRRSTWLWRALVGGSVAERVIRRATCPVLTNCSPQALVRHRFNPKHMRAAA